MKKPHTTRRSVFWRLMILGLALWLLGMGCLPLRFAPCGFQPYRGVSYPFAVVAVGNYSCYFGGRRCCYVTACGNQMCDESFFHFRVAFSLFDVVRLRSVAMLTVCI